MRLSIAHILFWLAAAAIAATVSSIHEKHTFLSHQHASHITVRGFVLARHKSNCGNLDEGVHHRRETACG